MSATQHPTRPGRRARLLVDPQVRVGLVAVVALLLEALLAAVVLDVSLSFVAQLAPLWIYTVYRLTGRRGRPSEILASLAIVVAAVAVLVGYAT